MNDKKIVIGLIVITLLVLGGGIFVLSSTSATPAKITASQNAKAEVPERTFDWGNITYSGEKATKTFTIKNSGSDALKLSGVKTSCTCTKAQISIDGKVSPYFSMHSTSGWAGEIPPGKEAKLLVIFDQAFHGPSGVGPIERLVSLNTNDVQNSTIEFSLRGVVVK